MTEHKKSVVLRTDWRRYRYLVLIGILLSPLLVGLILLYVVWLKISSNEYHIYDDYIFIPSQQLRIDLEQISEIETLDSFSFMDVKIADIHIIASGSTYTLSGVRDADVIVNAIQLAVHDILQQKREHVNRQSIQIKADPGTLERLNDLAGLLQEGLISYDDYLIEKKKFDQ